MRPRNACSAPAAECLVLNRRSRRKGERGLAECSTSAEVEEAERLEERTYLGGVDEVRAAARGGSRAGRCWPIRRGGMLLGPQTEAGGEGGGAGRA